MSYVGADLPNPWHRVSPPCPRDHPSLRVYLWHPAPEDGLGRWFCVDCGRRFSDLRANAPIGIP